MADKLNSRISIRLEDWMYDALKALPPTEKANLIEAIRKLIEHHVRQTSPTPAP